jgi:hypothetical protein
MDTTMVIQGRRISPADLIQIHALLREFPAGSRWTISRELCARWNWRTPAGQIKDMACRSLLRKLDQRGWIRLPPPRRRPVPAPRVSVNVAMDPICGKLSDLRPLCVERVTPRTPDATLFHHLLATHHYLGFRTRVGKTLAYLARDVCGRPLACALFGAAAWKIAPRDCFIGWDANIRARNLGRIVNNMRYLILPWVRVPHLASHLLGLLIRRLAADWLEAYRHPIALIETFVDRSRFHGICYRAANWICVGQTQGRSRQDRYSTLHVPIKDIYLYPLIPHFREVLTHVDA